MKKLKYFILSFLFISLMLFLSCDKGNPISLNDISSVSDEATKIFETVSNVEEKGATLYENLIQKNLSISNAKDSVLKSCLKDTSVAKANVNSQGIFIEFKNGILGGIFLDPEDSAGSSFSKETNSKYFQGISSKSDVNPHSKKTILLNPSYWERSFYTNQIIETAKKEFPKAGFQPFEVVLSQEVTCDKLALLSDGGYGIIHIYSHGWAYPKNDSIIEVYLMTGEYAFQNKIDKYINDLRSKKILISRTKIDNAWHQVFWVSPQFISYNNNFTKDTTLFYGGFCYSGLGNWKDEITKKGTGAYTGFSWSVLTAKNANWAINIYKNMCDTLNDKPVSLKNWFTSGLFIPKEYWDAYNNKWVNISYKGYDDLVLWQKPQTGVKIGTVWDVANLNVITYRNGDPIPNVTDATEWSKLTTGAYCNYLNNSDSAKIYGRLYNWYAVNDPRGLAPKGWHVASDAEWTALTNSLGGESVAGGKLKVTGTKHWFSPNTGATNSTGFSALPGGYRDLNGSSRYIGSYGYWWSSTNYWWGSTEYSSDYAWIRRVAYDNSGVLRDWINKIYGFSVRCVKDN